MSERDRILQAIGLPTTPGNQTAVRPISQPALDPWANFVTAFGLLGGKIITRGELDRQLQRPRWADPSLEITNTATSVWDAEVGLTRADFAIAASGSLVMGSGCGQHRLTSLVPPTNVVLISPTEIVGTLSEAIQRLPTGNVVMVTGPSRTADIEGVMVRGVHGPGELLLFIEEA